MHCKNFSRLDESKGYLLSPAYDLLAVLLADANDVDELACLCLAAAARQALPESPLYRLSLLPEFNK